LRNHLRTPDPLTDPGEQDLTAHVDFTELEERGTREGLQSYGLTNFARGLTSLATPLLNGKEPLSESWIRNFRHLTHPAFFGHSHKILVQGKSLPASFSPSIVMKV
jgi:SAM-dependent MidA family methyltransferase